MTIPHANFIEDPAQRGPYDNAVMCERTDNYYCSIFIEVSYATFITSQFKDWLDQLWTRLDPEAKGIAISIKPPADNLN